MPYHLYSLSHFNHTVVFGGPPPANKVAQVPKNRMSSGGGGGGGGGGGDSDKFFFPTSKSLVKFLDAGKGYSSDINNLFDQKIPPPPPIDVHTFKFTTLLMYANKQDNNIRCLPKQINDIVNSRHARRKLSCAKSDLLHCPCIIPPAIFFRLSEQGRRSIFRIGGEGGGGGKSESKFKFVGVFRVQIYSIKCCAPAPQN